MTTISKHPIRVLTALQTMQAALPANTTLEEAVSRVDASRTSGVEISPEAARFNAAASAFGQAFNRLAGSSSWGTQMSVGEAYDIVTYRTIGATTSSEWTPEKVEAAVQAAGPYIEIMQQKAGLLGQLGAEANLGYPARRGGAVDGAAFDKTVTEQCGEYRQAFREFAALIGPIDTDRRAGKLDPTAAAMLFDALWQYAGAKAMMGTMGLIG